MSRFMKKNRYRNSLKTPILVRIAFYFMVLCVFSGSYVLLKNRQVIKGDRIHAAENAVTDLDKEIELWQVRVAGLMDRGELGRRLKWAGSELREVDPSQVLVLRPGEEIRALPRVASN